MSRRTGLAVLLAAAAALGLGSPAFADSNAQKLAVAKQMFQAWHDLQWQRVYALFAEDGILHSMMDAPIVGRAAIAAHLGLLAPGIERIDFKVSHIGIIDGKVFVERVDDFVYKGHAGAVPVVGVLEINHGKVVEWRDYYDRAALLAAMGAKP
jgi:limonene-1,2-epoxide hydrolase